MAKKTIKLPHRSELQIFYPKVQHNGFGYCLFLKTGLTIGRYAFAVIIFGLGFGFCYDLPFVLYGTPKENKEAKP